MNKRTLISGGLGLILMLGAIPAFSQVKAKVPFDFVVPGKVFRSGVYTMTIRPHELRIGDGNGRVLAVVLANDAIGRSEGQPGKIVFRCYRDRCFLAQVWAPAQEHGLEFHLSPHEVQLRREQSGTYFALAGERP